MQTLVTFTRGLLNVTSQILIYINCKSRVRGARYSTRLLHKASMQSNASHLRPDTAGNIHIQTHLTSNVLCDTQHASVYRHLWRAMRVMPPSSTCNPGQIASPSVSQTPTNSNYPNRQITRAGLSLTARMPHKAARHYHGLIIYLPRVSSYPF